MDFFKNHFIANENIHPVEGVWEGLGEASTDALIADFPLQLS